MLVVWPPGLCPLHPLLPCNIRTKTKTPTPTGWSLPALTFLAVLLPPWHWASLAFIPLTPCESPRSHLCFLPLPSHLCWRTRRPPSSLHPGSRTAPTECGACKRMLNHPPCFFLPLLSPSLPRYSFFFFFFPLFLRDLEILLLAGTQFFKKMLWLGQLSCNQREEEELMPLSGDHFGQGGKFRGRERSVGPMGIYWLNVVVARCSEVRLRKFPSSEPPALLLQV